LFEYCKKSDALVVDFFFNYHYQAILRHDTGWIVALADEYFLLNLTPLPVKHRAKNMDVSWIGMLRGSQRDTDHLGWQQGLRGLRGLSCK
jgi:hypothetical protein